MALIRQVLQNSETKKWAYIEYSDESKRVHIMGDQEFDDEEAATEYSKGFTLWSYQWEDPIEMKRKQLIEKRRKVERHLRSINDDLFNSYK